MNNDGVLEMNIEIQLYFFTCTLYQSVLYGQEQAPHGLKSNLRHHNLDKG